MARTAWGAAVAALALALAAPACGGGRASGSGLDVVAAFYPIAEAARQVLGPAGTVHDLTPGGAEPHDLELKPSDVGLIRSADVVLYFAGGFQPAVEDAIEALPDPSRAVDLLARLPLLDADGEEADPHVWLDPLLMVRVVEQVVREASAQLPGRRALFESRAARYVATLEALHATFERVLATCDRRELVTSHAAFAYLAARYDLVQIAISGVSPEAEPSPRRLEEVARLAARRGVTTIFFETLVSPRVAETIARVVGAETAVLNPIEGLTDRERDAGRDYVSLMRDNLDAIAEGLGCEPS